jgi:DEAD/DEAH box helicase domain-containing protein
VLYDGGTQRFQTFMEKEAQGLIKRLQDFDLVVGFNIKRFDYAVLGAYTPFELKRLPTLDILQEVFDHLNFRLSLQALAEACLGQSKSADGLLAVEWWRQGRLKELAAYCEQDVALTRDLFCFGQKEGYLLYQRTDGARLRIPVDWSWPSLRRRFDCQG